MDVGIAAAAVEKLSMHIIMAEYKHRSHNICTGLRAVGWSYS